MQVLNVCKYILIFTLGLTPVYAQTTPIEETDFGLTDCSDTNTCLKSVVNNTYYALRKLNRVPTALRNLSLMALSWNAPDTSQNTAQMQDFFVQYTNSLLLTSQAQTELQRPTRPQPNQPNLFLDLFAKGDAKQLTPAQNPILLQKIPYVNDLAYSSLLGMPPFPRDSRVGIAPYNYFKNIAGVNLQPLVPGLTWSGDRRKVERYSNYFNSTMSIQAFSAYIMSRLFVESQKQQLTDKLQQKLINQATSATWFEEISSQELGKVLRQMLLFESQVFVMLNQLVQLQKDLLSTQVMTNTLLMLNNQNNEDVMVAQAQGVRPTY